MVSVCLPSDALLQHLRSYLGVSYLGRGVSLHGCSSKAQPLLLTLDEGYLLTAAPPDQNLSGSILGHTLQDSLELTPKKDDLFIIGDWNAKVGSQKTPGDTCTPMFIAALFIIARTWKQPRCPSADEWIRKLWSM